MQELSLRAVLSASSPTARIFRATSGCNSADPLLSPLAGAASVGTGTAQAVTGTRSLIAPAAMAAMDDQRTAGHAVADPAAVAAAFEDVGVVEERGLGVGDGLVHRVRVEREITRGRDRGGRVGRCDVGLSRHPAG